MNQNWKSKITSTQVPVVSFAARGTLLHSSPSFEKWCFGYFRRFDENLSESSLRQMLLRSLSALNDRAQASHDVDTSERVFFSDLLREFGQEQHLPKELDKARESYRLETKIVIPQSTLQVCEKLRERGYRLCIVSNETSELIEVLKMFHLLDLFDSIYFAQDLGVAKPSGEVFARVLDELELEPSQMIHVGDRFATDVLAARQAKVAPILYDPLQLEMLALQSPELTQAKVVSLEELRKNRLLQGVKVITRLDELESVFQ